MYLGYPQTSTCVIEQDTFLQVVNSSTSPIYSSRGAKRPLLSPFSPAYVFATTSKPDKQSGPLQQLLKRATCLTATDSQAFLEALHDLHRAMTATDNHRSNHLDNLHHKLATTQEWEATTIASRVTARPSACQPEDLQAVAVQLVSYAPSRALAATHMPSPICVYITLAV